MGKTHEALIKAETEYLKEFGKNNNRPEIRKPGRLKRPYVGLFILGLLTLIIAGYVYGRRDGKSSAADVEELQSAQSHNAQLDNALTLQNHEIVELEKRLYKAEKIAKEEQKARESQRVELLTNKGRIEMLQEQLKSAQSHQLELRDEIANSKQLIKSLRMQLSAIQQKLASIETAPVIVEAPKRRPEALPSLNLQKTKVTEKFDLETDDRGSERLSKTDDTTDRAKEVSRAASDPSLAGAQSPDPAKLIDWLLKKQSE